MKVEGENVGDLLASLGNENIIGHTLAYLELRAREECEQRKSLADAPNYVAWLWISAEEVFNEMRRWCFSMSKLTDGSVFDHSYQDLVDLVFRHLETANTLSVIDLETLRSSVEFVLIARHVIVHKGFPNVYSAPSKKARKLPKSLIGNQITAADAQAIRAILKDRRFSTIAERFHSVRRILNLVDHPLARVYRARG